jgi:hypothetical protein
MTCNGRGQNQEHHRRKPTFFSGKFSEGVGGVDKERMPGKEIRPNLAIFPPRARQTSDRCARREREGMCTMCRAPTSSQTDPTWIGTRSGGGRAGDGLGRTVCWAMIDALRCSSSAARAVDAEGEPARSRTERQRTAAVQPRATRAPAELQCQFLRQTR